MQKLNMGSSWTQELTPSDKHTPINAQLKSSEIKRIILLFLKILDRWRPNIPDHEFTDGHGKCPRECQAVKLLNGLKLEATIIMVETPVHHEKLPVDSWQRHHSSQIPWTKTHGCLWKQPEYIFLQISFCWLKD